MFCVKWDCQNIILFFNLHTDPFNKLDYRKVGDCQPIHGQKLSKAQSLYLENRIQTWDHHYSSDESKT